MSSARSNPLPSHEAGGQMRVRKPVTVKYVQADLMMALVAVIRDLLCEFLSD